MKNKVAFQTLGCKLNFSETSTIGNQFAENDFHVVDFKDKADVYVLNTCSVTETAEKECRQIIRRALRQNPKAYIIVTGCYAQLRPEEIANIDGVDAVLGSSEKFNLFSILNNFEKQELACIYVNPIEETTHFGIAHSTDSDSRTRAFLKIQDGCDYNCSFCTIPLARGSSRSLTANSVIEQFRSLVNHGYKEIILTGVNVGDYGKNINSSLFELVSQLINIEGEFRIRISSVEPNLITGDLLQLISKSDKMCNHLHIPLQSGSPKILKSMQRRYTTNDYKNLIFKAKKVIPDLSVGVDVIVGFPSETEADFIQTHNFLRDLPVSYLHVFTYSERPDTTAINLPSPVEVSERKRRNNILRTLSEKKKKQFYSEIDDTIQQVLFEHSNNNGMMQGYTSNYIKVKAEFNEYFTNKLTPFIIEGTDSDVCSGKILSEKMQLT
ncbi:MAG: tRNA (N(6)-L-threonylcarbamoyladenosine(37)-C(2))-methylthiotransferase MtaB [Ignavibacteriaceae bacterium]|nr:tRNA (N(6)-L-threonylcarbamoyladenosine(37)-C(2))-methylthiotransferase MtaB [Ignavibacteria bacterium]MBT8391218.1 tRNA (N(6)-L-threonylcarbamoyladenosine(37)-C(2))-methylthiotransferase MtaB [Ignavibacteria bacterium]NNL22445.1 tRNA (N(6)-L-threonylcarbamoyladenosine(37)-C(2))-methylthiotransferase MtaB [Ignavibacteriaceae bacterium]